MDTSRGQSQVERILLHIVQAITVAGIIGGYVSVSDLKTANAILQTKVENMTLRLDDFREFSGDRYTASQASRDIKPLVDRVADHEARIRTLERYINRTTTGSAQ